MDAPLASLGVRNPYGQLHTATTEAAVANNLSRTPSLRTESGGQSSVGAAPRQVGGGLASLGLVGGGWPGAGDHGSGPGAYMDVNYDRKRYQGDRWQHDAPEGGQLHRQSSLPQDRQQQSQYPQLASMFPSTATTVASAGAGRGDSDSGFYSAASRPLLSGMGNSLRSSRPWPGLPEAVATVEGQAPGGRNGFTFDEQHGDSGHYGGAGSFGGGGVGEAAGVAVGGNQRRYGRVFHVTCLPVCLASLVAVMKPKNSMQLAPTCTFHQT